VSGRTSFGTPDSSSETPAAKAPSRVDGRRRWRPHRQLLELALRAGRFGAWEWDASTGEVRWTEVLEVMHGLRPGQFPGTFEAFLGHIHPDDRRAVHEAFQAALEEGSLYLQYRIVCPDESIRWLECHGRVTRGRQGPERRMIGVCVDITERKEEEESLAVLAQVTDLFSSPLDARERLMALARLLVPRLADYCEICLLDEGNAFFPVAWRGRRGGRTARVQGLCPPHLRSSHPVARVVRTGRPVLYASIDGETLEAASRSQARLLKSLMAAGYRSAVVAPLIADKRAAGAITVALDGSGRRYGPRHLALMQEVGRRAGLALENVRLYNDLQRAIESKDEFLGVISHELRTPITTIYGGVRMLRSRGAHLGPEKSAQVLADMELEAERLFRMVEDLLALARLELGQRVEVEPVLVERVASRILSAYGERFPGRAFELRVEGESRPAAAQPVYLEQVIRNLLNNALRYSPPDSPIEMVVRYAEQEEEEVVEVHILDRGPGVPEEDLELIFERFYRSSANASRKAGRGIGLTVCKRLVEAQSGRIWARLREGGGLDVAFTLPIWQEDDGE